MINRQEAIEIFLKGVESVRPENLISRRVSINQDLLQIESQTIDLSRTNDIYVVGVGKASASMASAIESILGSRIKAGHIVTKYGHSIPLKYITITEAGHPVPDENGIRGTESILSLVNSAKAKDLVIFLISGGGSALLADVPEGCSLNDLKILNNILLKSGANITEINCIRKHLSKVKGGMLAKAAYPSTLVSLILSDVIGDPLDVIASGPTVPDPTTYTDAIEIVNKYNIRNDIPENILEILLQGSMDLLQETLKESDPCFLNTSNIIIGNNTLALENSKIRAESLGYQTRIITNTLNGDVEEVAEYLVRIIVEEKQKISNNKVCLLLGGEPTVKICGNGLGGRSQHLVLLMARRIKDIPGITFLAGGTDGTDGPTDAAGAVADSNTYWKASNLQMECATYINNFDSHNFFKQEGGLVVTGPTNTNVMDLIVILLED
ncbi:MAG: glycerate kinase [Porphyromonadaceae bacterium]|nr:glycerate kinase [Porphyromonadaceae bacterium]